MIFTREKHPGYSCMSRSLDERSHRFGSIFPIRCYKVQVFQQGGRGLFVVKMFATNWPPRARVIYPITVADSFGASKKTIVLKRLFLEQLHLNLVIPNYITYIIYTYIHICVSQSVSPVHEEFTFFLRGFSTSWIPGVGRSSGLIPQLWERAGMRPSFVESKVFFCHKKRLKMKLSLFGEL